MKSLPKPCAYPGFLSHQSEFPPNSWGFLFTIPPSTFEEIAFRGVILALFLRFYSKPKAILLAAISFGAYQLF